MRIGTRGEFGLARGRMQGNSTPFDEVRRSSESRPKTYSSRDLRRVLSPSKQYELIWMVRKETGALPRYYLSKSRRRCFRPSYIVSMIATDQSPTETIPETRQNQVEKEKKKKKRGSRRKTGRTEKPKPPRSLYPSTETRRSPTIKFHAQEDSTHAHTSHYPCTTEGMCVERGEGGIERLGMVSQETMTYKTEFPDTL